MIRSRLGWSVSPTFSMDFASAGKSQYEVSPTRLLPAPTANTISVRLGARETTLSTRSGNMIRRPASSVTSFPIAEGLPTLVLELEHAIVNARTSATRLPTTMANLLFLNVCGITKPTYLGFPARQTGFSRDLRDVPRLPGTPLRGC